MYCCGRCGCALSGIPSFLSSLLTQLLFGDDGVQVPEYRQVRRGMQCAVVVLSRSSGFYELTGVTEAYLPELDLFVGRFPLLDKR